MTASEKLTPERIAEIMAFPITYDEDCPKLTKEQIARLRPAHPENFVKEKRQKVKARPIDLSDIRELTEEDFFARSFSQQSRGENNDGSRAARKIQRDRA